MALEPVTVSVTGSPPGTPPVPPRPWTSIVTVDMVVRVVRRSVLHPFIAALVPLCLRAQLTPYTHPAFVGTAAWAALVSLAHVLAAMSRRTAYGRPRDVDWDGEVVVVTGGCRGLGRLLAQVYGLRGVSVAVLDSVEPPEGADAVELDEGWRWYRCDVGDGDEVRRAMDRVEKDLGKPTVLINNAAAPIKPLSLCSDGDTIADRSSIETTMRTNIQGCFNTLSAVLPDLCSSEDGGTIVTISSVLGRLAPVSLSPYSASKAAISALHTSLSLEIRQKGLHHKVKTILVETGQINTGLFNGVETPSHFFAPVLETREVAGEIVRRIDAGEGGLIRLPTYAGFISWYEILPAGLQRVLRWMSGIDEAVRKAAPGQNVVQRSK